MTTCAHALNSNLRHALNSTVPVEYGQGNAHALLNHLGSQAQEAVLTASEKLQVQPK